MTGAGAGIRPSSKASVPDNHLRAVRDAHGVTEKVCVIGIRGFFKSLAGAETGKNLTGVYDDAICLVVDEPARGETPARLVTTTFEGNTDPSRTILDRAQLQLGKYRYQRGTHGITGDHPRPAWIQAGGVTIRRFLGDGATLSDELKDQWIGCNLHDGSLTTTGSAGCQTVVPERWKEFDAALEGALRAAAQTLFWYILTS